MAKRFVILLLPFVMLSSCDVRDSVPAISTTTPISTAIPTRTASLTLTPIQTDTPTAPPDMMRYECLEIDDQPSDDSLKGVIIFNTDGNLDAFLQNNEAKGVYRFPREEGDRLLEFDVSPDRRHIMYEHSGMAERRLVIATADGQPIWSQVVSAGQISSWFDNERLINLAFSENGTSSLFLLNPFSGVRQELREEYPDAVTSSEDGWYPSWAFGRGGRPVYDPTLTRVVYPETDPIGKPGWPIVLWDVEADQMVTRITTMDNWGRTPLWTPDGKQFILATKLDPNDPYPPANEFFAVTREGEVRQLTHFMNYFQEVEIPNNYSLSPDGKLLAFWIVAKPSRFEDGRLAVLNIETGDVVNYCIKGDTFLAQETIPSGLAAPIWSPDSTQLLVISRNPQDMSIRLVILVDIVNRFAAQLAENVEPVGWMIAASH